MRLSIVIAAHNEGESLLKTVASCIESAGSIDHEILVADDASRDDSIKQLRHRLPPSGASVEA